MTTKLTPNAPVGTGLPTPAARTPAPIAAPVVAKVEQVKPADVKPQVTFTEGSTEKKADLNPGGKHVERTADPGALWGEPKAQDPLRQAMMEFKSLKPEAQAAKIQELKGQQTELSRRMLRRIDHLEARYVEMRNVAKGEMLQNLLTETKAMSPEQRTSLEGLLAKADGLSKEITALREKASSLPRGPDATPAQKAERKAVADQLRDVRARFTEATEAATKYVDSLGLKTDRLAVNEQRIDPNAPPKGHADSLSSMMDRWFEFDRTITKLEAIFAPVKDAIRSLQDNVDREAEQIRKSGEEAARERANADRRNAQDRSSRDAEAGRRADARKAADAQLSSLMRRSGLETAAPEQNREALNVALATLALRK